MRIKDGYLTIPYTGLSIEARAARIAMNLIIAGSDSTDELKRAEQMLRLAEDEAWLEERNALTYKHISIIEDIKDEQET